MPVIDLVRVFACGLCVTMSTVAGREIERNHAAGDERLKVGVLAIHLTVLIGPDRTGRERPLGSGARSVVHLHEPAVFGDLVRVAVIDRVRLGSTKDPGAETCPKSERAVARRRRHAAAGLKKNNQCFHFSPSLRYLMRSHV